MAVAFGAVDLASIIGLLDPLDVCRRAEARYRDGSAAAQRRRRVHPADPRLARICPRRLLAADARLQEAQCPGRRPPRCRGSTGPAKPTWPASRDVVDDHARQRLCPSHPAPDGDRQFRDAARGPSRSRSTNGIMAVYADAYEWVELPNTHGMATVRRWRHRRLEALCRVGAYINRMSDYCGTCRYDVKQADWRRRLPVQRALLGFSRPQPQTAGGQHSPGDALQVARAHERVRPRGHPPPGGQLA